MNFEDAIRKGLDIKAIKNLFIINIFAIIITLTLTVVTRQLIVRDAERFIDLNKYMNRYDNVIHLMHNMFELMLMLVAYN